MSDAQASHSNKATTGREAGGSKAECGSLQFLWASELFGQLMTGAVQCGTPLFLCFPFGYSYGAKPDALFPL